MLVGKARLKIRRFSVAGAGFSCGLAAIFLLFGSKVLQNAVAEGDTRTISMHHMHTDEDVTITYKRDGVYDEAALEKLNWFLRDWRREQQVRMDPHLIDLVWEVQRETGSKAPIWVVCGYRSPETNAMLRRRSSGVARFSQHMLGHAMDFYIPGVPLDQLRAIGLRLQRGGVGFYPSSGSPFVHMDTASIRMWPRMSRDQLLHVFPDGRTVHIPADGRPLPGYALALADVRKRGSNPSETSISAARGAGVDVAAAGTAHPVRTMFAKLFGVHKPEEDEDDESTGAPAGAATAEAAATNSTATAPAATPVPLRTRAKAAVVAALERAEGKLAEKKTKLAQVASKVHLITRAEAAPAPAQTNSPNEVITARGFWQGLPDGMSAAEPIGGAAHPLAAVARPERTELASADAENTGSAGPWSDAHEDRVPAELALAYAEQAGRQVQPRAIRVGTLSDPTPAAATTGAMAVPAGESELTIAVKRVEGRPASAIFTVASQTPTLLPAEDADSPWLRAVVLSPSVYRYLTTVALGTRDFRSLTPLMSKPVASVVMTFSADPNLGLEHDHFAGSAIVFISTVTYPTHTADLQ